MGKKSVKIFVCSESKCLAKGAKKVRSRLKELVGDRGLEDKVLVKKCDCLGRCGDAPVVEVKGVKKPFRNASPKDAEEILDAALHSQD